MVGDRCICAVAQPDAFVAMQAVVVWFYLAYPFSAVSLFPKLYDSSLFILQTTMKFHEASRMLSSAQKDFLQQKCDEVSNRAACLITFLLYFIIKQACGCAIRLLYKSEKFRTPRESYVLLFPIWKTTKSCGLFFHRL